MKKFNFYTSKKNIRELQALVHDLVEAGTEFQFREVCKAGTIWVEVKLWFEGVEQAQRNFEHINSANRYGYDIWK